MLSLIACELTPLVMVLKQRTVVRTAAGVAFGGIAGTLLMRMSTLSNQFRLIVPALQNCVVLMLLYPLALWPHPMNSSVSWFALNCSQEEDGAAGAC